MPAKMASARALLCATLLAIAHANGGHHGCPYLTKVVPQNQIYIDVATQMVHDQAIDCAAFSKQFSENGNLTAVCSVTGKESFFTQPNIETMCRAEEYTLPAQPVVTAVFPSFTAGSMVFVVQGSSLDPTTQTLVQAQFCKKTRKILRARVHKGEQQPPAYADELAGDRLLAQIFQFHDCSGYPDVMEPDALVEFNGEPKVVTRGGQGLFSSSASAQSACEAKAAGEKRVHTTSTITITGRFYDHVHRELIVLAERHVAVIFGGGVRTMPMAAVLEFSDAGKIKVARFYETEALHIQKKWGSFYGAPQPYGQAAPQAAKAGSAGQEAVSKATSPLKDLKEAKVAHPWAQDLMREVSAAPDSLGFSWHMILAVLSVGLLHPHLAGVF